MILTFYWGQNEENYHGSNTMFLVGVLMSVVGGIFVVFTIMALCYRSAIVHRKLLSCLRLVCLIPSSKPKKYSDKSDTLYRPSFLFPSNILQQLCSSHQKKKQLNKNLFSLLYFSFIFDWDLFAARLWFALRASQTQHRFIRHQFCINFYSTSSIFCRYFFLSKSWFLLLSSKDNQLSIKSAAFFMGKILQISNNWLKMVF